MISPATVYVIDDDKDVQNSLRWLIESSGHQVRTFGSAYAFLEDPPTDSSGCLILDVQMPDVTGLELQERLASKQNPLPVIVITGFGDVEKAVRAMRGGAFDFIEKPFDDRVLLAAVEKAIELSRRNHAAFAKRQEIEARYARLTPRERDVMAHVVSGKANKQIANALDRSDKTIEIHRAAVMKKMEATSLAELVRMAELLK